MPGIQSSSVEWQGTFFLRNDPYHPPSQPTCSSASLAMTSGPIVLHVLTKKGPINYSIMLPFLDIKSTPKLSYGPWRSSIVSNSKYQKSWPASMMGLGPLQAPCTSSRSPLQWMLCPSFWHHAVLQLQHTINDHVKSAFQGHASPRHQCLFWDMAMIWLTPGIIKDLKEVESLLEIDTPTATPGVIQ